MLIVFDFGDMGKLVKSPDLDSGVRAISVKVQVFLSPPKLKRSILVKMESYQGGNLAQFAKLMDDENRCGSRPQLSAIFFLED